MKIFICTRCHKIYTGYPALSRKDNKSEVCPLCGLEEALEDFTNKIIKGNKNEKKRNSKIQISVRGVNK